MTDPDKTRHWADLARDLGAEVSSEPSRDNNIDREPQAHDPASPTGPGVPDMVVDAISPVRPAKSKDVKRPTSSVQKENHWQTLASDFGVSDPIVPRSESRPSPTESSPEPLAEGEEVRPSPAGSDGLGPTTFLPEELLLVSENFMDEIADVETVEFAADEASSDEEDSSSAETPAKEEESDRKRRRRRRGRRGRRRGSRTDTQTADADVEGDTDWDGDETGTKETDHLSQAEERSELRGDEKELDVIGSSASGGREWDDDSDEQETGERARTESGGGSDANAGEGRGRENGSSKKSRDRKIPTWSDAIGVMINANLEGRRKPGSGGGSRGRRRRPGGKRK